MTETLQVEITPKPTEYRDMCDKARGTLIFGKKLQREQLFHGEQQPLLADLLPFGYTWCDSHASWFHPWRMKKRFISGARRAIIAG
jgi:hypothetical protein